jgi:hypothetical protein
MEATMKLQRHNHQRHNLRRWLPGLLAGVFALGLHLNASAGHFLDHPCIMIDKLGNLLPPGCEENHQPGGSPDVQEQLAALRSAVQPFHSIDVATAAGWNEEITGCMESIAGGMGFHFVNFDQLANGGEVSMLRPEALLYEPLADGSLAFVAVEYIIPEDDLARTDPPPVLFGQEFSFIEAFAVWGLHVWIGRDNPNGIFEDFNPDVTCDHADAVNVGTIQGGG